MDQFLSRIAPAISERWARSTPEDFTAISLALVVLAWYFSRFCSKP